MKQITNHEFNIAYENIENKKIIKIATKKYMYAIPKEELKTCALMALWNCLKQYDETKGRKFTSFLYKMVEWECNDWLHTDSHKRKTNKVKFVPELESIFKIENFNEFQDIISILPKDMMSLVECRILKNMSFHEMGVSEGISHETARRKYNKALDILKNVYRDMHK